MTDVRRSLSEFASAYPDEFAKQLFAYSHLSVILADDEALERESYDLYGAEYYAMSDGFLYFDAGASDLNTDAVLRDMSKLLEFTDIGALYAAMVEAGTVD